MAPPTYRFAAVIMSGRCPGNDWQGWMRAVLAGRGVSLGGGDDVVDLTIDGDWAGFARLASLDEAATLDATLAAWIAAGARPWIGAPVGVLLWTSLTARDTPTPLIETAMRDGRGAVVRLDNHAVREPVALQRFSLANLVHRRGWDEGGYFLNVEPGPYLDYVIATTEAALLAGGLRGNVRTGVHHHNPIGLSGQLERNGVAIPDDRTERVLEPLVVELWTNDLGFDSQRDLFWWQ